MPVTAHSALDSKKQKWKEKEDNNDLPWYRILDSGDRNYSASASAISVISPISSLAFSGQTIPSSPSFTHTKGLSTTFLHGISRGYLGA